MTGTSAHLPETAADTPSPPAQLLVASPFSQPADYRVTRAAGAANWLLMWTAEGRGQVRGSGPWVTQRPGDLVVLPAHRRHAYRTDPSVRSWGGWWVHFQPRAAWPAWLRDHGRDGGVYCVAGVPEAARGRVDAAFRRLHADARWSDGEAPPAQDPAGIAIASAGPGRELALGAIEEVLLLATASTAAVGRAASASYDPRMGQADAIIAADPGGPHTVRSLARQVALSPSRFAHLYAEQTGRTPMQAVRAARLGHAQRLLDATDLDIGQVARSSGFASPFHFSRAFRERFGVPPSVYRAGPSERRGQ
ncbi:helix-turn-helix domain-containing protein [Streptomyces sp. NBC_00006]|uniref:helix-turn-helix domain-containing protein n=1 Tax=Streptomyces sp. NBC_00006 TaxID=2975619 RepID=UPI00224D2AAA|nr:helix-turn-helix domain-containing protein [Streptomyces sp. NBC_00006]MCX5536763.1 helix-turn-helix domain-containing protein [Streptomyces sp. NBC_00006]